MNHFSSNMLSSNMFGWNKANYGYGPMKPSVKKKIPPPETELEEMSVEQVCNWLQKFGISRNWCNSDIKANVESFRQLNIDGRQLVTLTPESLRNMNIVWKLGHKLAITNAIKELRNSTVDVMEKYKKTLDRYKQSSTSEASEEKPQSEPLFERGKLEALKKRYMRPKEDGSKPQGSLKYLKPKAIGVGKLSESDASYISLKSSPITQNTKTPGTMSEEKLFTSTKLEEGDKLDLPGCSSYGKEDQSTGLCDKVRDSYVLDAPVEEPKTIKVLSDSDEADNYRDPYNVTEPRTKAQKNACSKGLGADSSTSSSESSPGSESSSDY